MKLSLNGFLNGGFDNVQKLKKTNLLDEEVSRNLTIKYNDVPINVGAYDENQKVLFTEVFNCFDWNNQRSVTEQVLDVLKVLKGNVRREQLYTIYNNAVDVAFTNEGREYNEKDRSKVFCDVAVEFDECLTEQIKVNRDSKPRSRFR